MNLIQTYRPKKLDDVLGQEHVIKSLKNLLEKDKTSAFLFEGPSGVGKTTLARICAEMLNATELHEINAATNSGVDEARALTRRMELYPMGGGSRVYIVDECQRLSKGAWEALLKDTEEPPPKNYWFFCTTEISKVPRTIRTRSAEFKLKSVSNGLIYDLLVEIRDLECFAVTDGQIERLAGSVQGSPREAIVKLSQADGLNEEEFEALLTVDQSLPGGYDLARLLASRDWDMKTAMELLTQMKDESPEAIRQVVRAYFTTFVMRAPSNKYALGILSEFETPAVGQNYITDIVMRLARINKWRSQ